MIPTYLFLPSIYKDRLLHSKNMDYRLLVSVQILFSLCHSAIFSSSHGNSTKPTISQESPSITVLSIEKHRDNHSTYDIDTDDERG